MELRNRWGTPIDPIPFFVVAATGFTVCYSFGPVYLITFDVPLQWAITITTGVYGLVAVGAYYRLVWTFRPVYREEVPPGHRFRRLILGAVIAVLVLGVLALPLFVG